VTRKRRLVRLGWLCAVTLLVAALLAAGYLWLSYHGPAAPVQVYRGITYSCEALPTTPESGGLLHLVKVDLSAPGVRFYITPLNPASQARGWQYRLQYVPLVVRRQGLAVAVNGTLFRSDDPLHIQLAGDDAHALETLVANHVVSHFWQHTYLLWWDDLNIAHLETTKPPSAAALAGARWAIGGQFVLLYDGKVHPFAGHEPEQRTMIAANPREHLVWLASFDRASYAFAGHALAARGATLGILVDGGWSRAMALGKDSVGTRGGRVTGCWRPVANVFGFYADPLPRER
jgi:hypothetical protein